MVVEQGAPEGLLESLGDHQMTLPAQRRPRPLRPAQPVGQKRGMQRKEQAETCLHPGLLLASRHPGMLTRHMGLARLGLTAGSACGEAEFL